MNCSLLDDEEYEEDMARMIPLWTAEGQKEFTDNRMIWDWVKYNIRAHAIQYSKRKAKERVKKELDLQEELSKAKGKLENNPNDHNTTHYNVVREKLESFYEEKTKGVIIRARARWHEHGEKSTKYFLNLEKRNHVKKHIRKLCINGKITTDPHCILKEQERFYRELYKSSINSPNTGEKISSFLNDLNIPQLSEEEKNSCEGLISPEECSELLAVITLLEKSGKDRTLLENWRPISLVNVDTKIMSKVIAARVKKVLPSIIHYNQTGYVKDRFIGEAIRSIFDIMDFTAKENIPGLLLFIDFQKAFDSVEWEFLIESLKKFNFGRDFLQWVKTFYNSIQSCVINNGVSSNFSTLERGVRQGDPVSPYLFIIA